MSHTLRAGRSTQRDPSGFGGGLNQYGYVDGDPVNGADPMGLRVCFQGNAQQRQQLADSTKKATGTDFDVLQDPDGQWCVRNVRPNGGVWTTTARQFAALADEKIQSVYMRYGSGGSGAIGNVITIDTLDTNTQFFSRRLGFLLCYRSANYTEPSTIAHELGHQYAYLINKPALTDRYAFQWQNGFNAQTGLPRRARTCGDHT